MIYVLKKKLFFFSNTAFLDKGDTNGDRDILKCNGSNNYRGLCVTIHILSRS